MRADQTFTTGGEEPVLAVSLELAAAKGKVELHDGRRRRLYHRRLRLPRRHGRRVRFDARFLVQRAERLRHRGRLARREQRRERRDDAGERQCRRARDGRSRRGVRAAKDKRRGAERERAGANQGCEFHFRRPSCARSSSSLPSLLSSSRLSSPFSCGRQDRLRPSLRNDRQLPPRPSASPA